MTENADAEATVFHQAQQIESSDDRKAYLDTACRGDECLRQRIEEMLEAETRADGFFSKLTECRNSITNRDAAAPNLKNAEGPGAIIDRYKLLEQIGEGGFGVVYMAEQQNPVVRKVALKIVKHGMDSKQVVARFEAERQALAMMDHPNIARVLDAGETESRRPYFVMELVNGVAITKFCDDHCFTTSQRLELFIEVCSAIQHAHQKGIIHRDVKPSNVMVTMRGDLPTPKVIDFGIAKATQHRLTEKTLFTQFQTLIGTPSYMAPEQTGLSGLDVDTRCDIYSLGVLLYELLVGKTPLDSKTLLSKGYVEMMRLIREEEPLRPSTRLNTLKGNERETHAQLRGSQPGKLHVTLRGDLDWIVIKALEKDRSRRYATAAGFGEDVRRYLNNDEVTAVSPSLGYRFRKFILRNKVSLGTAIGFAAVLIISSVVSVHQAIRATRAESDAKNANESLTIESRKAIEQAARANEEAARVKEQSKRLKSQSKEIRRRLYTHELARADAAFEANNFTAMRKHLDDCPEDVRGWEWARLNWLVTSPGSFPIPDLMTPYFSPDGRQIIACDRSSGRQSIVVCDAATGVVLREFGLNSGRPAASALSSDGHQLLKADYDRSITLWDVATGTLLWTKQDAHPGRIDGLAFSPDGLTIGSVCHDGYLRTWHAVNGAPIPLTEFQKKPYGFHGIAFNSKGDQILTSAVFAGSHPGATSTVWDARTGRKVHVLAEPESSEGAAVYSPNGNQIATATDSAIIIRNAKTGVLERSLFGELGRILNLAFSPDGRLIASGGRDSTFRLWDLESSVELGRFRGQKRLPAWMSFSPDGTRIAAYEQFEGGIRVWEVDAARPGVLTLTGHEGTVLGLAYHPNGRQIASTGEDGTVRLWNALTGQEERVIYSSGFWLWPVAYHPDGNSVAASGGDGRITLWDTTTGQSTLTLNGHEKPVKALAFSPDGSLLASGGENSTIRIWNLETEREERRFEGHEFSIKNLAFSSDGARIFSTSTMELIVWDPKNGQELNRMTKEAGGLGRLAISPDSNVIAWDASDFGAPSGGNGIAIEIFTNKRASFIPGHTKPLTALAFSLDGERLFSSSEDTTIRVLNPMTGDTLLVLRGHDAAVQCIAVSPDGKTIASGSSGGVIKLWETSAMPIETYSERRNVESARRIVNRKVTEHTFIQQVIESITADATIDEQKREMALRIALAHGDNAIKLQRGAEDLLYPIALNEKDSRLRFKKAEAAIRRAPKSAPYQRTLGLLQYRLGDYEDALETLRRADKYFLEAIGRRTPLDVGFIAMTLHRLDKAIDAQAELKKLRALMKTNDWNRFASTQSILKEAEMLIGGETGGE